MGTGPPLLYTDESPALGHPPTTYQAYPTELGVVYSVLGPQDDGFAFQGGAATGSITEAFWNLSVQLQSCTLTFCCTMTELPWVAAVCPTLFRWSRTPLHFDSFVLIV